MFEERFRVREWGVMGVGRKGLGRWDRISSGSPFSYFILGHGMKKVGHHCSKELTFSLDLGKEKKIAGHRADSRSLLAFCPWLHASCTSPTRKDLTEAGEQSPAKIDNAGTDPPMV